MKSFGNALFDYCNKLDTGSISLEKCYEIISTLERVPSIFNEQRMIDNFIFNHIKESGFCQEDVPLIREFLKELYFG